MSDNQKFVQAQPFSLAGAGVSIGNTSMILTSFKDIDGNNLTMTDFGNKGWMTIEPNSAEREEQISFTGITQNANGTATITGIKNVGFKAPYTETSGFLKSHPGGVKAVVSNTAGFYDAMSSKKNDETIEGQWIFPDNDTNRARISSDTDTLLATAFVTLGQLSRQAISGASNASETVKGIIELATATEAAAGTSSGSTGARLVAPNSLVNETSSATRIIPITNSSGKLAAGFGGANNSLATLNSSSLVVENPANATTTPTASKIPIADSNGKLDSWVVATDELFGDGSDGNATISSPTTLTSDKYYNNLTINDDLNADGYKIFVAGTLTIADGKKIYNNGGVGGNGTDAVLGSAGTAGTAGAVAGSGSLPAGLAGKAGVNGVYRAAGAGSIAGNNGTAGDNQTYSLDDSNGSNGGAGGYAAGGGAAGGTAGSGGTTTQSKDLPKNWIKSYSLIDISGTGLNIQRVSASGGSGGSGGANAGATEAAGSGGSGGSGATGGIVFVAAKDIVLNGSSVWLEAKGGNGGNAGASFAQASPSGAGGSGGGAGGNGGIIFLIYNTKTGSATESVAGGTGGTGASLAGVSSTAGANGVNGSAGTEFEFSI